jgi:hypothetical protein
MNITIEHEWNGNEGTREGANGRLYSRGGRWEWLVIVDGKVDSTHDRKLDAIRRRAAIRAAFHHPVTRKDSIMENRIVYADDMWTAAHDQGVAPASIGKHIAESIAAEFPITLGIVNAVTYNDKTDRYVVKFTADGSRLNTAKVTTEVAEYLLQHAFARTAHPFVHAAMADGIITRVLLRYLSRS